MIHKPYVVLYRGTLAAKDMTRKGAEAKAFRVAKEKGWELKDLEIKEDCTSGGN